MINQEEANRRKYPIEKRWAAIWSNSEVITDYWIF